VMDDMPNNLKGGKEFCPDGMPEVTGVAQSCADFAPIASKIGEELLA